MVLTRGSAPFRDAAGRRWSGAGSRRNASAFLIDKGNHRHFMAKEIHEQPEVVGRTLAHYLDMSAAARSRCLSSCRSMRQAARG